MTTRAPNVLMFLTDQHRPDHLGFGGNAVVRTPNLDALARRSLQFTRAYVANPICMPNRASIFTGRLPSSHGTRLRTLLTETFRLTLYEGFAGGELFDLRNDPDELRNLFDEPTAQQLRAAATEQLARALMSASDLAPIAHAAA